MPRVPIHWVLLLVTLLVFAPAIFADFVWDDNTLILENRLTHSWANLPELLTTSLWASTPLADAPLYYRPLMLLSLLVDRTVFGLSAMAHHTHSLLWHLLAVWLAWGLLRTWLSSPQVTLGLALFAVHPLQVEAVTFVAARNDAMATVFLLLAFRMLCVQQPRLLRAGLFIFCAGLSKESVFLAPALFGAVEWARTGRIGSWQSHLSIVLGLLAVVLLRAWIGIDFPVRADWPHLQSAFLPTLALYSERLLVPLHLVPGLNLAWPPPIPWGALAGVLCGCVALLYWGRRQALAGLVFAVVALLPALAAVAHVSAVPDRYMYLPLLGLGMAAGAATAQPLRVSTAGLWLLCAVFSLGSLQAWQSDEALWRAAHAQHQTAYTAGLLGRTLELEGDLDGAAALYAEATTASRPFQEACYSVTAVHLRRGDLLGAVRDGEAALAAGCPASPELLSPLSVAQARTGNWARAEHLALQVEEDPTGMAIVVRVAAAWRRGDEAPMAAAIAAHPDADPAALHAAVQSLITGH